MANIDIHTYLNNTRYPSFEEFSKQFLPGKRYRVWGNNGNMFILKKQHAGALRLYSTRFKDNPTIGYSYSDGGYFGGGMAVWQTCVEGEIRTGGVSDFPLKLLMTHLLPRCFRR